MTEKHRCAGKARSDGGFFAPPCSLRGSIEEAGKWWCHHHAPSIKAARDKETRARADTKYDKELRQRQRRYKLEALGLEVVKHYKGGLELPVFLQAFAKDFVEWDDGHN